jgi:hypothetical protein
MVEPGCEIRTTKVRVSHIFRAPKCAPKQQVNWYRDKIVCRLPPEASKGHVDNIVCAELRRRVSVQFVANIQASNAIYSGTPNHPRCAKLEQRCSPEWTCSWSFGIHCIRRTPDDPLCYHVVYDTTGDDWEYVPASRMLHVKANVPRNVKRGVSDLYWIANDVQREAKIRRNTADGAALQAAIAWFREHARGTTTSAVQSMVDGQAIDLRQQRTSSGTRPTKLGKLRSGTVVDIPETMKVLPGPMGSERNSNFILIAQYVARAIVARWPFKHARWGQIRQKCCPFGVSDRSKNCIPAELVYVKSAFSLRFAADKPAFLGKPILPSRVCGAKQSLVDLVVVAGIAIIRSPPDKHATSRNQSQRSPRNRLFAIESSALRFFSFAGYSHVHESP